MTEPTEKARPGRDAGYWERRRKAIRDHNNEYPVDYEIEQDGMGRPSDIYEESSPEDD